MSFLSSVQISSALHYEENVNIKKVKSCMCRLREVQSSLN